MSLRFPNDPLPLNSAFYIERPPLEELAYSEITKPGSFIRIKAPRKMGKSSLMIRLIDRAVNLYYLTAKIDFQQADEEIFTSLYKFLRWFCANVSRQLQLEPMLDEYWDEDIGSKVSSTLYFQGYLLEQINAPVVLVLNEVNRVFEHPEIARNFLSLLRSWHEEAKQTEIWQKLRLVVIHSTEVYVSLNVNQSPFNIGLSLQLPEFTLEQVQKLAAIYGLDWKDGKNAKQLMAIVGGHPYLINLALYNLVNQRNKWENIEEFLTVAPKLEGIYHQHLLSQLNTIRENPELEEVLKQIINGFREPLEAIAAYKLESIGIIKLKGSEATISCELYRLYFQEQLLQVSSLSDRLPKQAQKQGLSVSLDDVTQLINHSYFEQQLEKVWQQSAAQETLSLILCAVDYFDYYEKIYGYKTANLCLQQVADTIRYIVDLPNALIARYQRQEFAVLLPGTDLTIIWQIAEKIRQRVKSLVIPFEAQSMDGFQNSIVTVSLGIASKIPSRKCEINQIIYEASQALRESRRNEGDRISNYLPPEEEVG
ncbi:AAA-like domain-containing protein [Phormidium sp. LEGE 05292]|uniref:AAA-like domain-containing protein n=1 Tax=[Phormidium] sp. LEGE 05292 TaxID=767427 RepID=UPI0018828214|nr:AAA-like domain-containing protein [Phormidium sp. LEGE 05292]MBE9225822.1 AAA-like domain-containing protein [Phormidium sp. LEGE 05292]